MQKNKLLSLRGVLMASVKRLLNFLPNKKQVFVLLINKIIHTLLKTWLIKHRLKRLLRKWLVNMELSIFWLIMKNFKKPYLLVWLLLSIYPNCLWNTLIQMDRLSIFLPLASLWVSLSLDWINTTKNDFGKNDHNQHPAGRIGTVDDVVSVINFPSSKEASFITGQSITIDGGMSKLMIYNGDHGWMYHNNSIT